MKEPLRRRVWPVWHRTRKAWPSGSCWPAATLKQVAADLEISYPTLRKRVDGLIEDLNQLVEADAKRADTLLRDVETGRLTPEHAARRIREMNGDL